MKNRLNQVIDTTTDKVTRLEHKVDNIFKPVRESVLKRFPTLFLLLATFGVVATFLGFEQLLMKFDFFNDNPFVTLGVGIIILFSTGTLYKKLG